jgi:hypothetical protein
VFKVNRSYGSMKCDKSQRVLFAPKIRLHMAAALT